MINNSLLLPVLIPLLFGVGVMFAKSLRIRTTWIALLGGFLTLLASVNVLVNSQEVGAYAYHFGNWPAPFGIVFVADILSSLMISVSSLMGFTILIYGSHELKDRRSYSLYLAFILVLLASINGAFLTGDIFNLYVWFEVMLISSFALMVMDSDKKQIIGSVQYVVLNLISTMLILLAIGMLYGHTGSLNMADLHYKAMELSAWTKSSLMGLFFIGFAIKASLFPFYAWVPATYPKLPNTILAFFAGLLTKVGVYALLRVFTLIFPLSGVEGWEYFFGVAACLTMVFGVWGAASQYQIKNILSFHIVSQIGYIILGLALFTTQAITGAIFYLIHHIIVKTNLFLIGGFLAKSFGSDHLKDMGGAIRRWPFLAVCFIIAAFSLAGFPPLSGFWGKFIIIKSAFGSGNYLFAFCALAVGVLTLYSMTKIWNEAFWKAEPSEKRIDFPLTSYFIPIGILASLTLIIGLSAEPLIELSKQAAEQLLNPADYLKAVQLKGDSL